jgi:hypothetical protein
MKPQDLNSHIPEDDDMDGIIDMESYTPDFEQESPVTTEPEDKDAEGIINLNEHGNSKEAEEATWWDVAKESVIQPLLGIASAFTWPLDILKMGMIGEALSDIDELEEISKREGVKFDRDKYIKTVLYASEFIPTQELAEDIISKQSGINLNPKSKTGKALNQLFTISAMTRGKGLTKALIAGISGAGLTHGLNEAGANELVSRLAGDVASGLVSISKTPRQLSPQAQRLQAIAQQHGLPFLENMVQEEISTAPKITAGRAAALERQLGMDSQQAINEIVERNIPLSRLRAQGVNLDTLEQTAYDTAINLARQNPQVMKVNQIISEIDSEIARIRGLAPSPSHGQRAAINVLEQERSSLLNSQPTVEQMVKQTQNYNSNVRGIYKKPEFTAAEEDVRNAYGFLNGAINRAIDSQASIPVANAFKKARIIYSQNTNLKRIEKLLIQPFKDGNYSPRKLKKILNSRQGNILRRDIGSQGIQEITDIAEFGQRAQDATVQYARSPRHGFNIEEWGPFAGFVFAKIPAATPLLVAAKPFADHVRGWALTRPAARTVYKNIVKNAANGSFRSMAADFRTLEDMAKKEFGSMQDFIKSETDELQIYQED